MKKTRRVCPRGHVYFKSSDCPTCPVCEAQRAPVADFHALLGAPARRALERAGVMTLAKLARWTEAELLALHGVGPSTLPVLRRALAGKRLKFAKAKAKAKARSAR